MALEEPDNNSGSPLFPHDDGETSGRDASDESADNVEEDEDDLCFSAENEHQNREREVILLVRGYCFSQMKRLHPFHENWNL